MKKRWREAVQKVKKDPKTAAGGDEPKSPRSSSPGIANVVDSLREAEEGSPRSPRSPAAGGVVNGDGSVGEHSPRPHDDTDHELDAELGDDITEDDEPPKPQLTHEEEERLRSEEILAEVSDLGLSITSTREIFKAQGCWKLVWAAVGFGLLFTASWEISTLVGRLLAAPTSTRIKYNVNESITFPLISLCTYTRINATKVRNSNISDDLLSYMFSAFRGMYLDYNQGGNQQHLVEQLESEYQRFLVSQPANFNLLNWFMSSGLSCRDLIPTCTFMGSTQDCCSMMEEELSDNGKCFVLDLNQVQIIPGPVGGLKVYLNMFGSEVFPQTIINSNPDTGVQVHISHREHPLPVTADPVIAFPATHAMIRLNPVFRSMMDRIDARGLSTCTQQPRLRYSNSYSMSGCFSECIARLTKDACKCIQIGALPLRAAVNASDYCSPFLATTCVLPLMQDNNQSFLWDKYDINQECRCPLQCEQWVYEKVVSYSTVPNPGFEETWMEPEAWLAKNSSVLYKYIDKQNMIIVDIFFDNLIWTLIEERPIFTTNAFLGSLGGQLSVWLGMRFVTIIQFVTYFGLACLFVFPYHWRLWREKHDWAEMREQKLRRPVSKIIGSVRGSMIPTLDAMRSAVSQSSRDEAPEKAAESGGAGVRPSYAVGRRRLSTYSTETELTKTSPDTAKKPKRRWPRAREVVLSAAMLDEVEMAESSSGTSSLNHAQIGSPPTPRDQHNF